MSGGSNSTCPTHLVQKMKIRVGYRGQKKASKVGSVTMGYELRAAPDKMRRSGGAIASRVSTTLDGFGNEISML
jgi:hypothetical protein